MKLEQSWREYIYPVYGRYKCIIDGRYTYIILPVDISIVVSRMVAYVFSIGRKPRASAISENPAMQATNEFAIE